MQVSNNEYRLFFKKLTYLNGKSISSSLLKVKSFNLDINSCCNSELYLILFPFNIFFIIKILCDLDYKKRPNGLLFFVSRLFIN